MVATFVTTYNRSRYICREKDKGKRKRKKKKKKVELIKNRRKEKKEKENYLVQDITNYKACSY